ncbi:MAG: response regulator [Acidobacteriota bacterium]
MAHTILIIDDETAENGEEGQWLAEAHKPDLITLDILMPKKSGIKAYRGLRTSEKTKSIPIVVLTGLARLDDFFGDLDDLPKPDALVEKPIDRDAFLATVQGLLN